MSMSHKAHLFDISHFRASLADVLNQALADNNPSELAALIDSDLQGFTDPYEGEPLEPDWLRTITSHDTQTIADYALTRFYNVRDDRGIGDDWLSIDASLRESDRPALLGRPFGPSENLFDPGKMGAYFQDTADARVSLETLRKYRLRSLEPFLKLLAEAVNQERGVYVTF